MSYYDSNQGTIPDHKIVDAGALAAYLVQLSHHQNVIMLDACLQGALLHFLWLQPND